MQQERIDDVRDALKRALTALDARGVSSSTGARVKREHTEQRVLDALVQRLAMFDPQFPTRLSDMRRAASEAMPFFEAFQPHLIGALAAGAALESCDIHLECVCEHPDDLSARLSELKIPATQHQKSFKSDTDINHQRTATWFEFRAGTASFCLHALSHKQPRAKTFIDAAKLRWLIAQ